MHALRKAAETAAKTCGVYGAFGYGHPFRLEDGGSSEKREYYKQCLVFYACYV